MPSFPSTFRFSRWTGGARGALALCALAIACGARSGLLVAESTTTDAPPGPAVSRDGAADTDVQDPPPGPAHELDEGGPTDVRVECSTPPYCNPDDLEHIYECGVPTFRCGSLEQCEAREEGAQCVNPCLDTLGSDTSSGCEFYALETDLTDEAKGVCFAVFIVNQWKTGEPARIEVTRAGQTLSVGQFARLPVGKGSTIAYAPFDPNAGLPKQQVAILFLSRDPAALADPTPTNPRVLASCPAGVTPAIVGDASLHGTGKADAFRIRSNVPVVAYQMLPYGGGSARVTGATLLLPTNTWGLNYVVADAYRAPLAAMIPEDRAGPTTAIIASQDGTTVTVKPTSSILGGGGLAGTGAGVAATYTLNRGEYLQFTQPIELTGSAVEADKPVAVIGASTLMDLPLSTSRADSAEQMLPPVQALGSEYVAARYRNRGPAGAPEEIVPWRLVGVAEGTQLTYEPAPPAGAPASIGAQQLVEFHDAGPFVVRSQDANHPFYMASYMTGGEPFGGIGDPEFVTVIPPAQYLDRYTFFTDPTYPETNLVIVRVRDAATGRMPDVTLDCAGVLGGWQGVGSAGKYEMTRVNLATGDFQGVGACDNGVHTIVANVQGDSGASARFGVTVWGWGNALTWGPDDETNPKFTRWVSYGYPAGANVRTLNSVVLRAK